MASPLLTPAKAGGASMPTRPQLATQHRSSYLKELLQYRPPSNKPEDHYGIDTVVEDLQGCAVASPKAAAPAVVAKFNGIPSADDPPRVVESGINHGLSHPHCAPPPDVSEPSRLVATLFYRANAPRVSNAMLWAPLPPSSPRSRNASIASAADDAPTAAVASSSASPLSPPPPVPAQHSPERDAASLAPALGLDDFPLEPPIADPEPLDHLYGSFVSPMCVAAFLHLMSVFPPSPVVGAGGEHLSSHRCLDREDRPRVVELVLSPTPDPRYLGLADLRRHELVYRFEREWNVDVALQLDTVWRRYPRLVVFDMDSTLVEGEVIDQLAQSAASGASPTSPDLPARVADITRRAMAGELDFDAAFRERLALLRGLPKAVFDDVAAGLRLSPGVQPLLRALCRLGARTAVLSGGFHNITAPLAAELGIDHAHANVVRFDGEGRLGGGGGGGGDSEGEGDVHGAIVGPKRKRDLLLDIAATHGIALSQVVAVGDGANDLLMLAAAGLGVAWKAKPMVQMQADVRLNGESMLDLLYLFGFTRPEIEQLVA